MSFIEHPRAFIETLKLENIGKCYVVNHWIEVMNIRGGLWFLKLLP